MLYMGVVLQATSPPFARDHEVAPALTLCPHTTVRAVRRARTRPHSRTRVVPCPCARARLVPPPTPSSPGIVHTRARARFCDCIMASPLHGMECEQVSEAVPRPVSLASNNHGAFVIAHMTLEVAYNDSVPFAKSLCLDEDSHFKRLLLATGAHMHDKAFITSCFKNANAIGMRAIDFDKDSCSALWDTKHRCAPIMIQVSYNLGQVWALVQNSILPQTFAPMDPSARQKLIRYGPFDGRKHVVVDFAQVLDQNIWCKDAFVPHNATLCYIPMEVRQTVAVVVHSNGRVNFTVFDYWFDFPCLSYSTKAIVSKPNEPVGPVRSIAKKQNMRKQREFTEQTVAPCNESLDISNILPFCGGVSQTVASPVVDCSKMTVKQFFAKPAV